MEVILLPIILWILFSMFAADLGKKRIIGYWSVFWLSIILSPVIGLIIALMSPSEVKVVVSKSENESTGSQKICPDCAEDVKEAALKCKHCGYRWS
tara:strand:- start:21 stop:308 length:288 start_codon:yes stop_codon:yes gene_type:complete